jgi:hypothetical protein
MRTLSDQEILALRTAAQHLHRPRRRSTAELVRHLTGVQAQIPSAAALALRARAEGLTSGRVDRARLVSRSIVLTWAMRGTLHLVSAGDHGWLVPLTTEPRMANAHRRLEQEGLPRARHDRAVKLVEAALDREGPLTRAELAEFLRRKGIPVRGQAMAHLLWLAASRGVLCHGPSSGGDQRFVLVRDWVRRSRPLERDAALSELAIRYLRTHGPAGPRDLAFWSGLRAGDAARAWRAIGGRLREVETARGPRWMLRSQGERAPGGLVRLLPSFDEYLLGWRDRGPTASTAQWKAINRGGGWLHPVVLAEGRAVATWSMERTASGLRLAARPFSRLAPAVRRAVHSEAKDVGRFLATPVTSVLP